MDQTEMNNRNSEDRAEANELVKGVGNLKCDPIPEKFKTVARNNSEALAALTSKARD